MLRSLLAERFKLGIRAEARDGQIYALVVQDGGPKLEPAKIQDEQDCSYVAAARVACHTVTGGQGRGIQGEAVNVADMARFVENWSDRPILDKTGLEGLFSVKTEGWAPLVPVPPGQGDDEGVLDPARPTLFAVFAKLGLRLESQKGPVETYVIDSAERPSEN